MPAFDAHLLIDSGKNLSLIFYTCNAWLTKVFGAHFSQLLALVRPFVTLDDFSNNPPGVSSLELHRNFACELGNFPGQSPFATSCSPSSSLLQHTPLYSPAEVLMYTFLGNTSLQVIFQRHKKILWCCHFCSFLSTHTYYLGIYFNLYKQ